MSFIVLKNFIWLLAAIGGWKNLNHHDNFDNTKRFLIQNWLPGGNTNTNRNDRATDFEVSFWRGITELASAKPK